MRTSNDEGVSPVVGMVLLVAIAIVLAVIVFYPMDGGYSTDSSASLKSSGIDAHQDGGIDHVSLTLTSSQRGTLDPDHVHLKIMHEGQDHTVNFEDAWQVGDRKIVPCFGEGQHEVFLMVHGSLADVVYVKCDEDPYPERNNGTSSTICEDGWEVYVDSDQIGIVTKECS